MGVGIFFGRRQGICCSGILQKDELSYSSILYIHSSSGPGIQFGFLLISGLPKVHRSHSFLPHARLIEGVDLHQFPGKCRFNLHKVQQLAYREGVNLRQGYRPVQTLLSRAYSVAACSACISSFRVCPPRKDTAGISSKPLKSTWRYGIFPHLKM